MNLDDLVGKTVKLSALTEGNLLKEVSAVVTKVRKTEDTTYCYFDTVPFVCNAAIIKEVIEENINEN